jgi:hypothetical protein
MLEFDHTYSLAELQSLVSSPPKKLPREISRKYYEAGVVAQALCFIYDNPELKVVIPNDAYQKAPDALIEIGVWPRHKQIGVEVVTYPKNCEKEGFARFFDRTKLSVTIAYPEGTIIVCDVQLQISNLDRATKNISHLLQCWDRKIPYPVYLYNKQTGTPYLAKLH